MKITNQTLVSLLITATKAKNKNTAFKKSLKEFGITGVSLSSLKSRISTFPEYKLYLLNLKTAISKSQGEFKQECINELISLEAPWEDKGTYVFNELEEEYIRLVKIRIQEKITELDIQKMGNMDYKVLSRAVSVYPEITNFIALHPELDVKNKHIKKLLEEYVLSLKST